MSTQVWIAILVGLAAMIDDIARRQISNWICVAALAGGLGWQLGQLGWWGALYGAGGAAAGFGVFLIFYLLGGMGGGDVKLMAGFGALLGAMGILEASLWTAGIGGIMALAVIAFRAVKSKLVKQPAAANGAALTEEQRLHNESIPYAPAIVLGVWVALIPKG